VGYTSSSGAAEFGKEAIVSIEDTELAGMDHWLKGLPNGIEKGSPCASLSWGEEMRIKRQRVEFLRAG
jgi:hypothetical protein